MTELDYYKLFLDWLGRRGKVSEADIQAFDVYLKEYKQERERQREAIDFVNKEFKGMF